MTAMTRMWLGWRNTCGPRGGCSYYYYRSQRRRRLIESHGYPTISGASQQATPSNHLSKPHYYCLWFQTRNYLYIPLSWAEAKERFQRWIERTEQRIVNVRLLKYPPPLPNTTSLQDLPQQKEEEGQLLSLQRPKPWLRRQRHRYHSITTLSTSPLQQLPRQRRPQYRKRKAISIIPTLSRLYPLSATPQEWKLSHTKSTNADSNTSTTTASTAMLRMSNTAQDWRHQYQIWKQLRKEQYQGWKQRRKEQYHRWKQRRTEQYQSWKQRRKEQWKGTQSMTTTYQDMMMLTTRPVVLQEYSLPEWFDECDGRPLTSKDSTGRFVNPWQSQSTNGIHSITTILKWRWQRWMREVQQQWYYYDYFGRHSHHNNDSSDGKKNHQSPLLHDIIPPLSTTQETTTSTATNNTNKINSSNRSLLQFTWIGHSTGLVQMEGYTILVDPMFSHRASPFPNIPIIGVPRDVPPAYSIQELVQHLQKQKRQQQEQQQKSFHHDGKLNHNPKAVAFDICCITHDHYDHLDVNSIQQLQPQVQWWVVPMGIAHFLTTKCQISPQQIIELEWWQSLSFQEHNTTDHRTTTGHGTTTSTAILTEVGVVVNKLEKHDDNHMDMDINSHHMANQTEDGEEQIMDDSEATTGSAVLTITCCPASHWASRTMWDRNLRLWCSFAFSSSHFNVFYCGDTSYPSNFPLFRQIGDLLGPFDLATIPIGAYEPQEMMKDAHVNPHEAVQIHKDIRSLYSVGIHWGTFQLSEEPFHVPPQDLLRVVTQENENMMNQNATIVEGQQQQNKEGQSIRFVTLKHGETISIDPSSNKKKKRPQRGR